MIVAVLLSMAITPPPPRCVVRDLVGNVPGRCRVWLP